MARYFAAMFIFIGTVLAAHVARAEEGWQKKSTQTCSFFESLFSSCPTIAPPAHRKPAMRPRERQVHVGKWKEFAPLQQRKVATFMPLPVPPAPEEFLVFVSFTDKHGVVRRVTSDDMVRVLAALDGCAKRASEKEKCSVGFETATIHLERESKCLKSDSCLIALVAQQWCHAHEMRWDVSNPNQWVCKERVPTS